MTEAERERVATIAGKLSEAQRDDLLGSGRSLSATEAGEYVRMGLMRISFEHGGCGACLTETGLAVRKHLNGE